jgi:hypothetical protein
MKPTLEEIEKVAQELKLHNRWGELHPTIEELQAFTEYWMQVQRESDAAICDKLKSKDYCVDVREAAEAIRNNAGE